MREGKQAFALTDTDAVWHMRCRMAFLKLAARRQKRLTTDIVDSEWK